MVDLKVGDVVRLKSGGPKMTIQEIETYDFGPGAACRWFDEKQSKMEVFLLDTIEIPKKIQI